MTSPRRTLVVTYDVTDLTDEQTDYLLGEAWAQGEASEGHPDVPVRSEVIDAAPATVLGALTVGLEGAPAAEDAGA